jgi:hypothetical protein
MDIQGGPLALVGVYKFEGKKLFLATSPADPKVRPNRFVTNAGERVVVYELERIAAAGARP